MLLAKERRWLDSYMPNPPALQGRDLVRGEAYAVLTYQNEACWLLAGGRCSCRRAPSSTPSRLTE
jgi:hypothetical protein